VVRPSRCPPGLLGRFAGLSLSDWLARRCWSLPRAFGRLLACSLLRSLARSRCQRHRCARSPLPGVCVAGCVVDALVNVRVVVWWRCVGRPEVVLVCLVTTAGMCAMWCWVVVSAWVARVVDGCLACCLLIGCTVRVLVRGRPSCRGCGRGPMACLAGSSVTVRGRPPRRTMPRHSRLSVPTVRGPSGGRCRSRAPSCRLA